MMQSLTKLVWIPFSFSQSYCIVKKVRDQLVRHDSASARIASSTRTNMSEPLLSEYEA